MELHYFKGGLMKYVLMLALLLGLTACGGDKEVQKDENQASSESPSNVSVTVQEASGVTDGNNISISVSSEDGSSSQITINSEEVSINAGGVSVNANIGDEISGKIEMSSQEINVGGENGVIVKGNGDVNVGGKNGITIEGNNVNIGDGKGKK